MKNTINFLFFLHNHRGLGLTECFGAHLGGHFESKLSSIMGNSVVCAPEHIIKLLMEMSDDNKEKYLEWIDNNYKYESKYKSE